MGIKERRERVKQATREGILTSARNIARQEGWSAVTIRKVASAVEYSPSIVYEYFDSKEDILLTLLQDGFTMLLGQMDQAYQDTSDPDLRAFRMCDAYWNFAHNNPDLYEVMHGVGGVQVDPEMRAEAVRAACAMTERAIVDWANYHQVRLANTYEAVEIAWGFLHGIVSLALLERLTSESVPVLLHNGMQALLEGWRATSA